MKLAHLFTHNRAWAEGIRQREPEFFAKLSRQQSPEYLWIGCSDSRVPANQITGLKPGEVFVHRNIANVAHTSDMNLLAVLEYAVAVLKVEHIIVCGHYGCSGVQAALRRDRIGLSDNWLRHVQDIRDTHLEVIRGQRDEESQVHRLCELNVIEQAINVCQTTVVQEAWARGQAVAVHGNLAAVGAQDRVVAQEVGQRGGIRDVVHRDDLDVTSLGAHRAQEVPPDATEPVDCNSCHTNTLNEW